MQFSIVLHKAMMPKPDLRILKRLRVQGSEISVSWIHQMSNYRITEGKRERNEEQKMKTEEREKWERGRFWVSCRSLISI